MTSADWVKGNPRAAVVLIEYLDFECEACGSYHPVMKRLMKEFSTRIAFVTRYFPLPGHKNSMTAALAVEAAGRQGKYWEMSDTLLQNQETWGERPTPMSAIFERFAARMGLDVERFRWDVSSPAVRERVQRDLVNGQQLGVQATPTFFLNGVKTANPRGYPEFRALLQAALGPQPK